MNIMIKEREKFEMYLYYNRLVISMQNEMYCTILTILYTDLQFSAYITTFNMILNFILLEVIRFSKLAKIYAKSNFKRHGNY